MIVMKFGGTSIADASRILSVAEIVRERLNRRPVVVVSALAGVTDLLVKAVEAAREGAREAVEPLIADLARRHRWAVAGVLEPGGARHDLELEVDGLIEELRTLLRSVRILGEGTPRSSDTLLAFGEDLSSRIVTAAFRSKGLDARRIEARRVMITDDRHGAAEPDAAAVAQHGSVEIVPALAAGSVPVLPGFVGATVSGRTTTLGRGGSDTSAAVIGAALGAEEIQIWTDVDGILSADPKVVPAAALRERVTFAEAAELAHYGAKVLHPASVAPAVRLGIPVRVLNSLRPEGRGTVVLADPAPDAPAIASIASRSGVRCVRARPRSMRADPGFLPRVLDALSGAGLASDLVLATAAGVTVAVGGAADISDLAERIGPDADVETIDGLAIVCVVGQGLASSDAARARVLAALSAQAPLAVGLGASGTSASVLVPEPRLAEAVRGLHRTFFEGTLA